MPDILIPHCVQGVVKGRTGSGEELLHVMDFRVAAALPSTGDVAAVAAALGGWVAAHFVPNIVRTLDFVNEIICTSRAEVDGPEQVISVNLPGGRGPSLGDSPLPNEITLAMKKSTGLSGRAYRGRFYLWPFWNQDTQAFGDKPNEITAGFGALVLLEYTALVTDSTTAGVPLSVASNVHAVVTPVTSLSLTDGTVDSQRRRGPGRGA